MTNNKWQSILDFWFGNIESSVYGKSRPQWFNKNEAFDLQIREKFLSVYEEATSGALEAWSQKPFSCLALIICLDQFPRNLFRNTPKSFATDTKALNIALMAISKGFDEFLLPVQRWFMYLPLEHSENLDHQTQCVNLFLSLKDDPESVLAIESAQKHYAIIERFGRFPHRNMILNRFSTPEELQFLEQPNSSF